MKLDGEPANTTTQDLQRTLHEAIRRLRRIGDTRPDRQIIDMINNGFKSLEKKLTSLSLFRGSKTPSQSHKLGQRGSGPC